MVIDFTCPNCGEESIIQKTVKAEIQAELEWDMLDEVFTDYDNEPIEKIILVSYKCGHCEQSLGIDHQLNDDKTLFNWLDEKGMLIDD